MTDQDVLDSLDKHFGWAPSLSTTQLREHQARLSCAYCDSQTRADELMEALSHD